MDRRSFLQRTGALVAGGLAWSRAGYPALASAADGHLSHIGVQLYTLRSILGDDFAGTLEQIAGVGYKNLEFAGYYGHTPADVRKILDDLGLKARSGHFGMPMVQENPDTIIEGAVTLGMEYVVVPALPTAMRADLDAYKTAAAAFNELGEKCKEAGVRFGYHNHGFEFEELDGVLPYDVLLDETDPQLVVMELDLAWIEHAGKDPLAYFERHPGRFPLWHLKDIDEEGELANVGAGRIDFPAIFAKAEQAGLHYGIVEHDRPGDDPVASIAASYAYLDDILG
ncbi:MAG: sugar phosphate isomerase/epimerase [Bacteroidetes bacterium SB0662_bin_6]|nr:sugar phosphate isomerase/epimerase [Bacteroidetes bacterium SB0668_bin_1]MYE04800.1 sugar phosphate isomerase/epimerase [Bacteroidetes bacterium SB0662_bin_6]